MPSESQSQQELMAIALKSPSKVYARNRGVLKMNMSQLKDFASTARKGLPKKVKKPKGGM